MSEDVAMPPASPAPPPSLDVERDMLASLTEAINSDLDLRRVLQTVADIATDLSGAQFGAFFYNDEDHTGRTYQLHVLAGAGKESFAALPTPTITALTEPTFAGHAVACVDDLLADPRAAGMPAGHPPVRSYLAVPVVTRTGQVIGAIWLGHGEPGRFGHDRERVVRVIAAQAAVAIENARLFAAEQSARRRAEQATQRLALLQALTDRLAPAMTTEAALAAVAETLIEPMRIARVGLFLRETDGFRAVASHDGTRTQTTPLLVEVPDHIPNPLVCATAGGKPVMWSDRSEFDERYPALRDVMPRPVGPTIAVPLISAGKVLGGLSLAWDEPHEFSDDETEMLVAAGGQLASTVERARLFEAERAARVELRASIQAATETSHALQRSLLPHSLPDVHGMSVAVRYRPSSVDAEVGGDWYDAVATDDGAIFVIGDVQGHSLAAAALMGQLRIALHAYLAEGHPIDSAVLRANQVLADLTTKMIATCCVIRVDTVRGELHVVRAGHPAPLLRRADGTVTEIDARPGIPLGVLASAAWTVTTVPISPGDRIVLFTDGLVERRDADIDHGIERLRAELVHDTTAGPDAVADHVIETLGRAPDDDVALLICDYRAPVATSEVRTFPGARLAVG